MYIAGPHTHTHTYYTTQCHQVSIMPHLCTFPPPSPQKIRQQLIEEDPEDKLPPVGQNGRVAAGSHASRGTGDKQASKQLKSSGQVCFVHGSITCLCRCVTYPPRRATLLERRVRVTQSKPTTPTRTHTHVHTQTYDICTHTNIHTYAHTHTHISTCSMHSTPI